MLSLCISMGIQFRRNRRNHEVATVAIVDRSERILRIKTTIALLLVFQSSLTTLVVQWRQRNLPDSAMHFQGFCIAYFLVFVEHSSSVTTQKIFDMWRFRLKNRRFDGKRATKLTTLKLNVEANLWRMGLVMLTEVMVSLMTLMQGRHRIASKRQVYVREAL